jgi:hypothetical protein
MFKVILLVSVPVAIIIGIGNAFADNPNVPSWSPYALMPIDVPPVHARSGMAENRASSVQAAPNANAPTWSPYTVTPQAQY